MAEALQFLYKIQPTRTEMLEEGPTAEEEAIVAMHFAYLRQLVEQGAVIMAGRTLNTDESSFSIVIFEAESLKAAKKVMKNDPAIKENVMRGELYPFRASLIRKD